MNTYSTAEERELWPEGHRPCVACKSMQRFSAFHKHSGCVFGVNTVCKACRKPKSKVHYHNKSTQQRLYDSAKSRAVLKGVPFSIDVGDIVIPKKCPVFGTPFSKGDYRRAASLDRINPSKGYVKGNIQIVSNKANMMKGEASSAELRKFAEWIMSCEVL